MCQPQSGPKLLHAPDNAVLDPAGYPVLNNNGDPLVLDSEGSLLIPHRWSPPANGESEALPDPVGGDHIIRNDDGTPIVDSRGNAVQFDGQQVIFLLMRFEITPSK